SQITGDGFCDAIADIRKDCRHQRCGETGSDCFRNMATSVQGKHANLTAVAVRITIAAVVTYLGFWKIGRAGTSSAKRRGFTCLDTGGCVVIVSQRSNCYTVNRVGRGMDSVILTKVGSRPRSQWRIDVVSRTDDKSGVIFFLEIVECNGKIREGIILANVADFADR